ncbi:hypothetical protein [Streptomyces termitum]|uniref:hypothetical protein n=1 Tax=Streptomyces termitum TaxID=67368 RepID=UPI0037AFC056
MSITSPIPVLLGEGGAELRSDAAGLLLLRPREEVRIPLAAVARVHADGRVVAVELTAPPGTEPALHRIGGVSRAAGTVFAEAVNALLPERPEGTEAADGAALVTVTPRGAGPAADPADPGAAGEPEEKPDTPADLAVRWSSHALHAAAAALAVTVGIAGGEPDRALAVLLTGALAVLLYRCAAKLLTMVWEEWYLPRHGVTVEAEPVLVHGRPTYAYTTPDGRLRPLYLDAKGETVRVAYHPRYPARATAHKGPGARAGLLAVCLFLGALTALAGYLTAVLALPALR